MAINVGRILSPATPDTTPVVAFVTVPDVAASSEGDARKAYEDAQLSPRVVRVEGSGKAAGTILEQDPKAGTFVARRSRATIYVAVDAPPSQASINAQFATLEANLSVVGTDVAAAKADVASVKTSVAGAVTDLTTIKGDVATARADVTAVKADVGSVRTDVTAVKADVGTIRSDVAIIKSAVTKVEAAVVSVGRDVAAIKARPAAK